MPGDENCADQHTKLLLVTYGLFLAGFFFIPQRSPQYLVYYFMVLLPFLPLAWRYRQAYGKNIFALTALTYIGYLTLSALWSTPFSAECIGFITARGLLTASFLLVTAHLAWQCPAAFTRVLKAATLSAAVFGIVSIVIYYTNHPSLVNRLVSFAQIDNPNTMGVVYGLFTLLAVNFASSTTFRKGRTLNLWWVIVAVLFIIVLLTNSRNALIACLAGILVMSILLRSVRILLFGILAVLVLTLWLHPTLANRLEHGGISYRLAIWSSALKQIEAAPIFGHGLCTNMALPALNQVFTHPHSVYLVTLWHGGLIGLLLLAATFVMAFKQGIIRLRKNRDTLYVGLLVFMVISIIVDFGNVITRPREPWLYFWLPLALTLGTALRNENHDSQPSAGKHK